MHVLKQLQCSGGMPRIQELHQVLLGQGAQRHTREGTQGTHCLCEVTPCQCGRLWVRPMQMQVLVLVVGGRMGAAAAAAVHGKKAGKFVCKLHPHDTTAQNLQEWVKGATVHGSIQGTRGHPSAAHLVVETPQTPQPVQGNGGSPCQSIPRVWGWRGGCDHLLCCGGSGTGHGCSSETPWGGG